MTVLYIFYCYVKLYILISLEVNLRIMSDSGSVMEKQKAIARYLEAIRLFEENDFIIETEYFCNRIFDIDSSNVEAKKYLEQIQSRDKNQPLVGL